MRAVHFMRGATSLGNIVDMRCARAVGAWVAVDLEKAGKAAVKIDAWRDSRGRGGPMRRRGRDGFVDALCRDVRLGEVLEADMKLVVGPDAGVLKEGTVMLLDGVKCSFSPESGAADSSCRRGV